jgi:TonB family protein
MTPPDAQAQVGSKADPIAEAIFRNGEGITGISVEVDVKGLVTNCRVTESSGSQELDDKACQTFENKAKFQPWRGPDRTKVRKFSTRIVWRITE